MSSKEWSLPLNLAIGFHLLLALAVVYLPHLLTSKPRFEEIYTVNLINIAEVEPAPASPPATTAQKTTPKQTQPAKQVPVKAPPVKKVVEKAIALEEPTIAEPTPVAPTPQPEAISIAPSKHKVKAKITPPVEAPPPKKVEQDFSQARRQKLAEMIRAEQQAAEEAQVLAEEAELEKRLAEAALAKLNRVSSSSSASTPSTAESTGSSNQQTALEKQYYAAIIARLQQFWSLPEYQKWDPALKATVIITVQKDGQISGNFFELQSGDKIFDRFVTKALQDAGYLPPIPAAIRKDRLELGLNFTPGGIR